MSAPGTGQDSPWSYSAGVLGLTGDAFILLRDLVVQRTGVYFDESKRDMFADKVAELVVERGLSSFLDYYYLLRYDDDAERHWLELRNRLAVPETYFWRQPEQFEALARHLVPEHFRRPGARPLRIWSAACCSGEEPLSIAMALAEAGWLGRERIEIVGSDGSPALLERARRGIYRERAFRSLPPALRDRYFSPQGDGWRVDPALQAHVEFRTANLVEPEETSALASSNIIFCRNVFIYFSDDAIRRVSGLFYERMPVPGHLFLGAPESLTRLGSPFELKEIGGAFVYVKEAPAGAATEPPIRLEPGSRRRPAGLRQETS